MRILVLANSDLGLYKFRKELIEELLHLNNEVYLSLPYGDFVSRFEKMGCTFIDTPIDRRGINPKTDLDLFLNYRKIIKAVNPDLIITYTIKPNIYGGTAARIARIQYAENITGLGTAFEKSGALKRIVVSLYKIALKKAKVVFFENVSNRDELIHYKVCKKDKTVVLRGAGVNTEYYGYQPYPHNDKVKFLFVGRVMKEKGVDELFESMRKLVSEKYECFLDVIGPFEDDYKKVLEQCETEGWLKYHGYQEDVRPFIGNCDCFVLPSYHEGMANTNLESASCGRPIITTNIPGCKEAVLSSQSGFLCEPRNIESLYSVMRKMIEQSRSERLEMGIVGRKHMKTVFDKRMVVRETIDSLLDLDSSD